MLVLFSEGVLKDVSSVEVQPLDFGDGKISGTQINFVLTNGDELIARMCRLRSPDRGLLIL